MRNLIIALILSSFSIMAVAAEKNNQPQVQVQFAGYKNSEPVYKVSIKNPENVKLNIVIRDADGVVLHEELVEGTNIVKSYRFTGEDLKASDLVIEVSRYADPLVSRIKLDKSPLNK